MQLPAPPLFFRGASPLGLPHTVTRLPALASLLDLHRPNGTGLVARIHGNSEILVGRLGFPPALCIGAADACKYTGPPGGSFLDRPGSPVLRRWGAWRVGRGFPAEPIAMPLDALQRRVGEFGKIQIDRRDLGHRWNVVLREFRVQTRSV